ncbi:recombination protein RecR [Myxococcota bacterium]|nr:recombination protein RecR [Myxococcota bacterium]
MSLSLPPAVAALVAEFRRLPGVGEKTALRYVLHLLGRGPEGMTGLRSALAAVEERVRACTRCGFFAEEDLCVLCQDPSRDPSVICAVEGVGDLLALERVGEYRGLYHVLGGALSVLRGVPPERLRIGPLVDRVRAGGVREVIVATSADAEGETTALYLRKVLEGLGVQVTRPATGIPMGSSLEYLDGVTLLRALRGRREL